MNEKELVAIEERSATGDVTLNDVLRIAAAAFRSQSHHSRDIKNHMAEMTAVLIRLETLTTNCLEIISNIEQNTSPAYSVFQRLEEDAPAPPTPDIPLDEVDEKPGGQEE